MNENLPTNVQLDANGNGSVSFATDVIATIAGLAATEVEGVASMFGSSGLADILTRKMQPARTLTKGVKVELTGETVSVNIAFVVEYGSPVPEVAAGIQENVKKAIETMSGLSVSNVDVQVQGVSFERENRAAAELEMKQRLMLQKQQEGEREEQLDNDPVAQAERSEPPVQEAAAGEPSGAPVPEAAAEPAEEEPLPPDDLPEVEEELEEERPESPAQDQP